MLPFRQFSWVRGVQLPWPSKIGGAKDEEDGPFFCLECGCWAHPDGEAAWVEDHKCLGFNGQAWVKGGAAKMILHRLGDLLFFG